MQIYIIFYNYQTFYHFFFKKSFITFLKTDVICHQTVINHLSFFLSFGDIYHHFQKNHLSFFRKSVTFIITFAKNHLSFSYEIRYILSLFLKKCHLSLFLNR